MTPLDAPTTITIAIEAFHDLTVEQVWPDGDAPDAPTADDVMALLQRHGLWHGLRDWSLGFEVTITVNAPNPTYTQAEALLPELAPPPRLISVSRDEAL